MTTCKDCGRQVVWGRTESGTRVMLDVGEPIYDLVIFDSAKGDYVVRRRLEARAAHRWICPGQAAAAPPAPAREAREGRA